MPRPEELSAYFHARLQEQLSHVESATVPIYADVKPTEHVGSGVLVQLGGERFLLTAAHVTDHRHRGHLYLGGERTPVRITGNVTHSRAIDDNRDSDKVDAAVIHLSAETVAHIGAYQFLGVDDLDVGEPRHDDYFLVAGYPCSKQRLPREGGTIEAYLYPFVAVSKLQSEYPQALDPSLHVLLGFDKREMWRPDVGRVTAPDPYGLSGCGTWWLEGYSAEELSPPRLAAIVTEWHPGARRILGSRISVLLSAVWRDFPNLRDLLP